jgi:superfamily II DNA helicase RecQ
LESKCVLYWAPGDFSVANHFASEMSDKGRSQQQAGIDCMRRYCSASACRRKALLMYFGARPRGSGRNICVTWGLESRPKGVSEIGS